MSTPNNIINIPKTFGVNVGGTGLSSSTAYSVLCGGTSSTSNFQSVSGLGTSGQVLTSNGASSLPTWQSSSSGGISYVNVTTSTQAMVSNTYYIANDPSSQITFTLPATMNLGDVFGIQGYSSGGWVLNTHSGSQAIIYLSSATSTSVTSNARYDSVYLVCTLANTIVVVTNSVSGGLTFS